MFSMVALMPTACKYVATASASSTVFPGNSEQSFVSIQRGQSVTLFPMIEASQRIPLQSLLSLLEHMRRGAALKRLVQKHRDALANLR